MNHSWEVLDLSRIIETGEVTSIFWRLTGVVGDVSCSYEGTTELNTLEPIGEYIEDSADSELEPIMESTNDEELVESNVFISYENLTQPLIIKWIEEREDVDSFLSSISQSITETINPTNTPGLPW